VTGSRPEGRGASDPARAAGPRGGRRRYWRWVFRNSERRTLAGIPAGVFLPSAEEREAAFPKLAAALDVLARHDPRRFERLRADVDGILVFGLPGARGAWILGARLVVLKLEYVTAPETSAEEVASTLVHEGTHAWLDRLGFGYDEPRRARIEAICYRAQLAFARRLPDPGGLVELAQRQLSRDPADWSDAAFERNYEEGLRELGVPGWLVRLLGWRKRRRSA
jgi:hypothetical protein